MGKFTLTFYGSDDSGSEEHSLKCWANNKEEIYIELRESYSKEPYWISLDIPTAIKFAKTLRTEINKAKEVYNG